MENFERNFSNFLENNYRTWITACCADRHYAEKSLIFSFCSFILLSIFGGARHPSSAAPVCPLLSEFLVTRLVTRSLPRKQGHQLKFINISKWDIHEIGSKWQVKKIFAIFAKTFYGTNKEFQITNQIIFFVSNQ